MAAVCEQTPARDGRAQGSFYGSIKVLGGGCA